MQARHLIDNITATLVLGLKKSVLEVYNMQAQDVIYTYATLYIDSYNQHQQAQRGGAKK